jgi:hypothetical protein
LEGRGASVANYDRRLARVGRYWTTGNHQNWRVSAGFVLCERRKWVDNGLTRHTKIVYRSRVPGTGALWLRRWAGRTGRQMKAIWNEPKGCSSRRHLRPTRYSMALRKIAAIKAGHLGKLR